MNAQFEAAWELRQLLAAQGVPYAIIGGLAVQYWGEPRLTQDVDATIVLPTGTEEKVLSVLLEAFEARIPDALAFALKHRVLLVQTASGCNLDLSLGFLDTRNKSSHVLWATIWATLL